MSADVSASSADVSASSADIVASNGEYFVMSHNVLRVFHDVSQCFKSVSWCFKSVSWCFTSGSRCFTMYHNVLQMFHDVLLCLTMLYDVYWVAQWSASQHRRPRCHRSRQLRMDRWYRRESDAMLNSVLNGDWSNSVPGRQFPKGLSSNSVSGRWIPIPKQECGRAGPPAEPLWNLSSRNRVTPVSIQDGI